LIRATIIIVDGSTPCTFQQYLTQAITGNIG
jgi:hypothetical protein